MSQTIFSVAPEVPSKITFVVATQNNPNGKVSQIRQVNSHLANYGHAKRRRKVFGGRVMLKVKSDGSERIDVRRIGSTDEGSSDARMDETDLTLIAKSHQAGFDEPLLSVLDPFLIIPENVSQVERSMLAFYLLEGKNLVPGTCKNPAHCVSVRLHQDWLQYTPILITHTLMHAEFLLRRHLKKEPLTMLYYKRRTQTLAMVRRVLSDERATYSLRLFAVMTLVWAANTMEWAELQTHLNAVNILLEATDKAQRFVLKESEGPTLRPQWLVGMFLATEFHITKYEELLQVKYRFIEDLKNIARWAVRQKSLLATVTQDTADRNLLEPLRNFLLEPIRAKRFGTELPFAVAAAPFFCCFSICTTFAVKDLSAFEALTFLYTVQRKLVMIDHGCSSGGTALSHLMSDARLEASTMDAEEEHEYEVRICHSTMSALKIYSLLSITTRIEMTESLFDLISFVAGGSTYESEVLWKVAEKCGGEIENRWWPAKHQPSTIRCTENILD